MSKKWSKEIPAKIIAKAWKDPEFKNKLLNNPKEALKEFGIELDDNIKVSVIQEDPSHFYMILPKSPAQVAKLSEKELENLAAAKHMTLTMTCYCIINACHQWG